MFEVWFLFAVGFAWILFASVQDIKSREVANWISFSLIIFALGFRFFYSLFSGDFNFLLQGVLGLGIFFAIGYLFYYSRMFAGGDTKLMIALGSVIGFSGDFLNNVKSYLLFIFLFLLVGAVYGLVAAIIIGLRHFQNLKKGFSAEFKKYKNISYLFMVLGILLMAAGFWQNYLFAFGVLIFLFPYFYIYAKAVDDFCMVKRVPVGQLTEGDWLHEQVKIGRKLIVPQWGGLEKKDIILIRKKFKFVLIKNGIPYIPVFLVAYLLFYYSLHTGLWNSLW